jgi:death-on-curing family protein
MRYITVAEVKYVAHELAKELMIWNEPIPDFTTRYPQALERCLFAIAQTYDKKELYRGLSKKAAVLFYLMIKNHPFQNGNKRVAVMTLIYFLYVNKKWIRLDNQELYNFAKWVAESNPKVKDATVSAIELIIKTYMVNTERIK